MNQKFSSIFLAPLCFSVALAFSTSAAAHDPKKPQEMHSMASHSEGSMELHKIMTDAHKAPMPMSGNVDKDFAMMMSMHHEQAIKMADVLLKHGSSAELKAMAAKMKSTQQEEIKQMAPYTK